MSVSSVEPPTNLELMATRLRRVEQQLGNTMNFHFELLDEFRQARIIEEKKQTKVDDALRALAADVLRMKALQQEIAKIQIEHLREFVRYEDCLREGKIEIVVQK